MMRCFESYADAMLRAFASGTGNIHLRLLASVGTRVASHAFSGMSRTLPKRTITNKMTAPMTRRKMTKGGSTMATDLVFVGIWLMVGAIAGWLSSLVVMGGGVGLVLGNHR